MASNSSSPILSDEERNRNFTMKINAGIMLCVIIILGFTSQNPAVTIPLTICVPVLGMTALKLSQHYNRPVHKVMPYVSAPIMFLICWKAGPEAPGFFMGFTNLVYLLFNIESVLLIILFACLSFASIAAGSLMAGMSYSFLFTGLFCLSAFMAILMSSIRFMIRQGKEIEAAKKIIEDKSIVLERQKELIEDKQKELLDSIHYAKRIQSSLLPRENYISRTIERLR